MILNEEFSSFKDFLDNDDQYFEKDIEYIETVIEAINQDDTLWRDRLICAKDKVNERLCHFRI